MTSTALPAGTKAPDFTLPSTPDQKLKLSEPRGRPVLDSLLEVLRRAAGGGPASKRR